MSVGAVRERTCFTKPSSERLFVSVCIYTFFIMFCQTERVCSIFRFMDSKGEHLFFFLYKISFTFFSVRANACSFLRVYVYFHVFTFFPLTQLFFLFICPFSSLLDFLFAALRVNKQRTRGPRFILFVSKINFPCLFCLLLICTFPKRSMPQRTN